MTIGKFVWISRRATVSQICTIGFRWQTRGEYKTRATKRDNSLPFVLH